MSAQQLEYEGRKYRRDSKRSREDFIKMNQDDHDDIEITPDLASKIMITFYSDKNCY